MTRSQQPSTPELPESSASELHSLYHEAARDEPGPLIDKRILDAARAELSASGVANSRRPAPWWRRWLPATSAIAAVVVGLSVTLRVMDEQERRVRDELNAAQTTSEAVGKGASALPPAESDAAVSVGATRIEKSRPAQSAVVRDAPVHQPEPDARPAPAAPAAIAPVVADAVAKKSLRAERDQSRDRGDASAAMEATSSSMRQTGKLEGRSLGTSSGSDSAAGPLARPFDKSVANSVAKSVAGSGNQIPVDAATPEAWLKTIRELRASGSDAEAAQSLARFRGRYPDFALPDDLLNLK